MIKTFMVAFMLLGASFGAFAEEEKEERRTVETSSYYSQVFFHGYDGEGAFVEWPATAGNFLGFGLAIAPAKVCGWLYSLFTINDDQRRLVERGTMQGITMPFGIVFGFPTWLVKQICYNVPIYSYEALTGRDETANPPVVDDK